MCAIVDNNVRDQVFGESQSAAGKFFLDWLGKTGLLVVGGLLSKELGGSANFVAWFQQALQAGRALRVDDNQVEATTVQFRTKNIGKSDDQHVLALARVTGARLLFTNDRALQQDFGNPEIVGGNTRGRVYTTIRTTSVTQAHRDLLKRDDLCNA